MLIITEERVHPEKFIIVVWTRFYQACSTSLGVEYA